MPQLSVQALARPGRQLDRRRAALDRRPGAAERDGADLPGRRRIFPRAPGAAAAAADPQDRRGQRRQSIQQATQAWETLQATRATIESTRAQIRANQIALEGTQREAIVGSRTTLDVLNAEQTLLNSRVTLVQNLANLVTNSYAVAAAIGRLTARDLNLNVPLYDETAYYNAVRQRCSGPATTRPTSRDGDRWPMNLTRAGAGPDANAPPGADPSMEDILASIRRILNEEDTKPAEEPSHPPADDVLALDEGMMVSEPSAPPTPPPPRPEAPRPEAPRSETPRSDPPPPVAALAPPANEPPPTPSAPPPASSSDLVAPEAAAAAATAVGALLRTLASERNTQVHRGGPTIEDLVREEIRPLLKQWLDTHLAPMVERLVRTEIERVVGRMT